MKAVTIMLAVLAPAPWGPGAGSSLAPTAGTVSGALVRQAVRNTAAEPDTGRLVVRRVWAGVPDVGTLGRPTADGESLTFVDWAADGNLGVRRLSTGEVRHVTDKRANNPDGNYGDLSIVSRDGQRVAYHWYAGEWTFELHVVDLDGNNRRILIRGEENDRVAPRDWSPDGRDLLVTMKKGDQWQLVIVSVEDGSQRLLKLLSTRTWNAGYSSDGRYVVYDQPAEDGSSGRDIYILPAAGGGARPLIEGASDDYLLGWVPDSDYLLFASDRSGTLGAWIVRVVDGELAGPTELVKPDLWRAWPMGFAADRSFFYGVRVSTRRILLAPTDSETGKVLAAPTPLNARQLGNIMRPQWSFDGRYLSYVTGDAPGSVTVVIQSVDNGEIRKFDPRLQTGSPAWWSPDGRHLLLVAADVRDRLGLFRMDVQTGEVVPLRLFEPGRLVFNAAWAPDGRTVYYKVDYESSSHLVALDVESGSERILRSATRPTWIAIGFDLSPDGQQLAFWEREREGPTNHWRLMLMPTSATDSPAREVLAIDYPRERQPNAGFVSWAHDGRSLLYRSWHGEGDDAQLRFWRIPVEGGSPRLTEIALDGLSGGPPQFSPDGHRVAFETGESAWEVWVMKNYLPEK